MIEQEVKLQFGNLEAARQAVTTAGGRLVVSRRLLDDRLFDFPDGRIRASGMTLRIRRDAECAYFTLKGPVQPGTIKTREEWETSIGSAAIVEAALAAAGMEQMFRSQKYREEYELGQARIAIDEAPVGVFVEIEASPEEIDRASTLLGRTRGDYRVESYPTLWRQWRAVRGLPPGDMLFDTEPAGR
jgi:adenylate cyclase class 2